MNSIFNDLSGLNVCRYDYKPGWKLISHHHRNIFQVFYIFAGQGTGWISQQPFSLQAGAVIFVSPGIEHGLRPTPKHTLRTLDAKFRIRSHELLVICRRIPTLQYPKDPHIFKLLESVQQEAENRTPYYREICQLKLKELVLRLGRQQAGNPPTSYTQPNQNIIPIPRLQCPVAQNLLSYLKDNYSRQLSSKDLAHDLSYSYRHLANACRRAFGVTPLKLLIHVRVDIARQKIAETRETLKQIALSCGFANVYHFSRVFNQLMGMPPSCWRQSRQQFINRQLAIDPGFRDYDRTVS